MHPVNQEILPLQHKLYCQISILSKGALTEKQNELVANGSNSLTCVVQYITLNMIQNNQGLTEELLGEEVLNHL